MSVDVRGGRVSTSGWTEQTQMPAEDALRRLTDRGVRSFVYTNVERDGKRPGLDLDEVARVAETVRGRFVYSAGSARWTISGGWRGCGGQPAGVIVGKALYEGRFTVAEAQAALDLR